MPPSRMAKRVPPTNWLFGNLNIGGVLKIDGAGRIVDALWDAPDGPSPEILVVDPGRAFGTGTHETTRLCLGALEVLAARRPLGRTLDLGSGTALLAIAAGRLGAGPVFDLASRAAAQLTDPSQYVRAVLGEGARP